MLFGFVFDYFGKLFVVFNQCYLGIQFDIIVNDCVVDFVEEGFDIVFQIFLLIFELLIE